MTDESALVTSNEFKPERDDYITGLNLHLLLAGLAPLNFEPEGSALLGLARQAAERVAFTPLSSSQGDPRDAGA